MLKEIWVKNGEKKSVEQEYYPSFFGVISLTLLILSFQEERIFVKK